MDRRYVVALFAAAAAARPLAATAMDKAVPLKKYLVTIRVFDPGQGLASGTDYELPVDSPDEEHAAASTLANAASFTAKTRNGAVLPVAFCCTAVKART